MTLLSSRNNKIDFIRGFAILTVLVLHFNLSYHLADSALNRLFNIDLLKTVFGNGNYGVIIFFVVSGFLITTTSIDRFQHLKNINLSGFYIYRFSRIIPCLALALSLILIFSQGHISIFENDPNTVSMGTAIFSVFTFWHNILMQKIGYFNYCLNIYWSLSVEEVFYLTFPIICLLLKRPIYIAGFLVLLILLGPVYRSLHSSNEIIALYGYFSCFDAIALGCLTALAANKIKLATYISTPLTFLAWTTIISMFVYKNIMDNVVVGVSVVAIATAILLMTANQPTPHYLSESGNKATRTVRWFGKNSYELYLFHIIVLAIMKQSIPLQSLGDVTKLVWFGVFIALSALVSGIIAKCYSQPMNKSLRAATGVTLLAPQ